MWVRKWEGLGWAGLTCSLHAVLIRLWLELEGSRQWGGSSWGLAGQHCLFMKSQELCVGTWASSHHGTQSTQTAYVAECSRTLGVSWSTFYDLASKASECYFRHTLVSWSIRLGRGCRPYLSMETCQRICRHVCKPPPCYKQFSNFEKLL